METKMATQQEMNVRVAVRVRPLLPKERVSGEEMCVRTMPSSNQLVLGKDRGFTFDYVLSSKTTQEEVYKSCVESLVRSIFEGYNATVFAYGQTGSGKTYTVGGGNMNSITEEEYGIIPRALKDMFDYMQANKDMEYSVKVSYIEIYKEELQDLLDVETPANNLHVREDDKGNTVIIGAREVECETLDDVMSLLESGSSVRHTGSTQMNEQSSRSHSVFTVNIGQKWSENDVMAEKRKQSESTESLDEDITHTMFGKFHFVDLAGSERAHRTGNVGDRFKESVHINSGLLALGNVISALGDPKKKATHIPYRESKITRLLKDSLGGNAKTLMICCISPSSANLDESHNALKYANRARNIKNTPVVNRDVQSIRFEEMQSEIKALREELVRQRTSMLSNGCGDSVYNPEKAMQDALQMKKLEDHVIRLQTECSHYKMIAEEAYRQLIEIQQKDILSKSQDVRLKDWLDLMEEIKNKVPATLTKEELENQTIRDLQSQLNKCREDLKSDEEIFAEKNKEFNGLSERNEELGNLLEESNKRLSEAENQIKKQEHQLIEQQIKIEELNRALKDELFSESSIIEEEAVTSSAPAGMTGGQRPKSVPVQLSRRPDAYPGLRPPSRNIKTSPALFTLERVMKSFRARSQLLVSRLEDSDEVMHQTFEEEEEDVKAAIGSSLGDGTKFTRKGTYKVKKGKTEDNKENNGDQMNVPSIRISKPLFRGSLSSSAGDTVYETVEDRLRKSINTQRKIKETQIKMSEDHQKMRDLSINIRMKEQLIKELVKTGKDAETLNKQYADKIKHLEREKEKTRSELEETQKVLTDLESNKHQEKMEKQRLQQEYKKKIELAKAKMSAIQRKQKETEKIANFSAQNSKKISDLEMQVDRMRQQQDQLQKRLKDESDKKGRLEKEMQKEAQKVKDLQKKNEQQQKLLKKKNEEIAAAQRKLRTGSLPPIQIDDIEKMEEQRRWLDNEVEKVVEQRRQVEELEEMVKKREEIVSKKEAILNEKSELEMKKLRSSQVINKNILTVSTKLDTVDRMIDEKNRELAHTPQGDQQRVREELGLLQGNRDMLQKKRAVLEEKLQEGKLLSGQEERRMIELDEAIEALDAAIEYKNDNINSKKLELRHSQILSQSEDSITNRLNALSAVETKTLLSKYFEKVINLREQERKTELQCSEMEVKLDEQERLIRELEGALQRAAVEVDRRLTKQQREYEQKMQLLMHQITTSSTAVEDQPVTETTESKIHRLEKDLYFYKKTSRDLKRKLKDLIASGTIRSQDMGLNSLQSSVDEQEFPPMSNNHSHIPGSLNRERESRPLSGRSDSSRPNSARNAVVTHTSITPVKISRNNLRLMSEKEVSVRRSNLSTSQQSVGSPPPPHDSLDPGGGNNPWG